MTHTVLLQKVWGAEYRNELDYLRVFIRRLRRKIEQDPSNPQYILTDARVGYRFRSWDHVKFHEAFISASDVLILC